MAEREHKLKVLIAARDRETRERLRQSVLAGGKYQVAGTAIDGQEAVQLAVLLRPDVAIIEHDLPIINGFKVVEMVGLAAPEVRSVLLGNGQSTPDLLQKAMAAGARAYLPAHVSSTDFASAIENLTTAEQMRSTPEFLAATDSSLLPKIVVVTGAKGGIGKTTIATSLAMHLGRRYPGKVVLLDMYMQFGDVATMLDLAPQRSLADLVHSTGEIDADVLETCMVEHETGIRVLVSSTTTQPIDSVGVNHIESIVHILKRGYTFTIIDVPPILHSTSLYLAANCGRMLIITTLYDMPTVSNCKQLYDKLISTYTPEEKIMLIANRVSRHDRLSLKDVENLLGRPVSVLVPNDPRLVNVVNQGVPFVQAYPRSPFTQAIGKIADEIINSSAGAG